MGGTILYFAAAAIQFVILARLLTRTGWSPVWGLVVLMPLGWIVMLWVIAFGRWSFPDSQELAAHPDVIEAFE